MDLFLLIPKTVWWFLLGYLKAAPPSSDSYGLSGFVVCNTAFLFTSWEHAWMHWMYVSIAILYSCYGIANVVHNWKNQEVITNFKIHWKSQPETF